MAARSARRRRSRPRPFCCWPGCREKPLEGRAACEEHVGVYDRVRAELDAPREAGPVKRIKTVRKLCEAEDCDEFRRPGSVYCASHDDDR